MEKCLYEKYTKNNERKKKNVFKKIITQKDQQRQKYT